MSERAKHLSVRLLAPLLDVIEERVGTAGLEAIAEQAGLTRSYIRDDENWVDLALTAKLNEVAVEVTGDPSIPRDAGIAYSRDSRYLGTFWYLARGLGTPGGTLDLIAKSSGDLNRVGRWEVESRGKGTAVMTWFIDEGLDDHLAFCENRIGTLMGLPQLWGLPLARVDHHTCGLKGGSCCRYELTWLHRSKVEQVVLPLVVSVALLGIVVFGYGTTPLVAGLGALALLAYLASVSRLGAHLSNRNTYLETTFGALQDEFDQGRKRMLGLDVLSDVTNQILSIVDEELLLDKAVQLLRSGRMGFQRAAIMLRDGTVLSLAASDGYSDTEREALAGFTLPFDSASQAEDSFKVLMGTGETRLIEVDADYISRQRPSTQAVIDAIGLSRYVAAPIRDADADKPLGMLIVDRGTESGSMDSADVHLCEGVANHIGLALVNARLFRSLKQSLAVSRKFAQYLPKNVAQDVIDNPEKALKLGGTKRPAAVLFSDIVGFTTSSEQLAPERVVTLLNRYFGEMDPLIEAHQGILDKRMGDGMMVAFPEGHGEHPAHRAAACGRAMQQAVEGLQKSAAWTGFGDLRIRVGIHFGEAVAGNLGSPRRVEYTLIGDVVNTASRVESLAEPGTVVVTAQAAEHIPQGWLERLGEFEVRGRSEPVALYRVRLGDA